MKRSGLTRGTIYSVDKTRELSDLEPSVLVTGLSFYSNSVSFQPEQNKLSQSSYFEIFNHENLILLFESVFLLL